MSNVITPILLLIASIGLFFTYLKPAYNNLVQFQAQETEILKAIDDAEKLVVKYENLLQQRSSISSVQMKNLEMILPNAIDVVGMIIDVDSIAQKHNLEITSFQVPYIPLESGAPIQQNRAGKSQSVFETNVGDAILEVEFVGEYPDFKNFLFDIERSVSLTDVVNVGIEVGDTTIPGEEEGITFSLGLQTYWLKNQQ